MELNSKNQLLILNSFNESLIIMDLDTKNVISHTNMGKFPINVQVFKSKIYVLNCDSNSLSIFDEASLLQLEEVYLGEKPSDILIDKMNYKIYVANSNGNSIYILDLLDKSIKVINVDFQPFRLLSYDNQLYILSYIYNGVINYSCICTMDLNNFKLKENKIKGLFLDFIIEGFECLLTNSEDGYLYSYDIGSNKLSKRIYLGGLPNKIISCGSRTLYISDLIDNCVKVVDLENNVLKEIIKVGKEPQGFILL